MQWDIVVSDYSSVFFSPIKVGQNKDGRITHFLSLPTWGQDFPWKIVTQPVGIFQTPRVKDKDIIFQRYLPFALLYVEWFGAHCQN